MKMLKYVYEIRRICASRYTLTRGQCKAKAFEQQELRARNKEQNDYKVVQFVLYTLERKAKFDEFW